MKTNMKMNTKRKTRHLCSVVNPAVPVFCAVLWRAVSALLKNSLTR